MRKKVDRHLKKCREKINPAIKGMNHLRRKMVLSRDYLEVKLTSRYSMREIKKCFGHIASDYFRYLRGGLRRKSLCKPKPKVLEIGIMKTTDNPEMEQDYTNLYRDMELGDRIRNVLKLILCAEIEKNKRITCGGFARN